MAVVIALVVVPQQNAGWGAGAPSRVEAGGPSAPSLTRVDLGTLGGRVAFAYDINEARQVVGTSMVTEETSHAFLWTADAGMIDLGTLSASDSAATAINNRGHVVGGSGGHAFMWTPTTGMVNLGEFEAADINDSDQVTGSLGGQAIVWGAKSGLTYLGTLGGSSSSGRAINNRGDVAGVSGTSTGVHAFVWSPLTGMRDLGTLGGSLSEANGINDRGEVVGWSVAGDGQLHPFRWSPNDGMVDLMAGASPSDLFLVGQASSQDINGRGEVVGYGLTNIGKPRPFTWTQQTGIVVLGGLGYAFAFSINNRGDIAGGEGIPLFFHADIWITSP